MNICINNYTLNSYNIQKMIDIVHLIRIEMSCATYQKIYIIFCAITK